MFYITSTLFFLLTVRVSRAWNRGISLRQQKGMSVYQTCCWTRNPYRKSEMKFPWGSAEERSKPSGKFAWRKKTKTNFATFSENQPRSGCLSKDYWLRWRRWQPDSSDNADTSVDFDDSVNVNAALFESFDETAPDRAWGWRKSNKNFEEGHGLIPEAFLMKCWWKFTVVAHENIMKLPGKHFAQSSSSKNIAAFL